MVLAKAAFEDITHQWEDNANKQRALLLAELTPSIQTFVACGIAFDAFYEQMRPFAKISEAEVAAWKKNKTRRSAQMAEVIRRVYKLHGEPFREIQTIVKETIKFRDLAVHPSHKIQRACNRPDIPVGLDWRFCAFRYKNAVVCYKNILQIFTYLHKKRKSPEEKVNANMEAVFEALEEMGLTSKGSEAPAEC